MSLYEYTPLTEREIRTLLLHPVPAGELDAPIRIELKHRHLDEQPEYEALSYTWGDASSLHEIHCDDRVFRITANLKAALLSLRDLESPREIWVDAVCIDQSNEVEKQSQIAIMRQIFGTAKKTVVWLGEEADDVAVAIDFFNQKEQQSIEALVAYVNTHRTFPEHMSSFIGDVYRMFGINQYLLFIGYDQQRTQRAIANFLARPWFRRAWTVQEFIVSQKIEMRCGDLVCTEAFAIPNFEYAFNEAHLTWHGVVDPGRRQDMFRGMSQMLQLQGHRNAYQTNKHDDLDRGILTALRMYRGSQTTMPEDKIWAFQSLAYEEDIASHLSSWAGKPKRSLYLALATYYMDSANPWQFKMLSEASRTPKQGSNLPSWVPDWGEIPTMVNFSVLHNDPTKWRFVAGGHSGREPEPCFHVHGEILRTTGSMFCSVLLIGDRWADHVEGAPNLSSVISAAASLQHFLDRWPMPSYFNGESYQDVFWSTLQAGRKADSVWFTSDWDGHSLVDPLGDLEIDIPTASTHMNADMIDMLAGITQQSADAGRNFARAAAGRRAAVCCSVEPERLYVGMVPAAAEEGDEICILRWCATPLVLRPLQSGRFRLIGDCYIHGVMGGELVDELTWHDIEIE